MSRLLPGPVIGAASFFMYLLNTLFWTLPVCLLAVFKLGFPAASIRKITNRLLNAVAAGWISVNTFSQRVLTNTRIVVRGLDPEALKRNRWYLVMSNHQSWVDILVLQRIFNRRIPLLKFFIKKEMIWMPILGQIWWIFDFPFMKRYSKRFLEKNPHLRGRDMDITRRACEKFREIPISVMNFVEGTRFTAEKHRRQDSPYQHLLRPKAGGVATVLATMGEQLHRIIDVTIVYPDDTKSFWAFLSGKVREIRVNVDILPIRHELLGDYFQDSEFRRRFQEWLNTVWETKDDTIDAFRLPYCGQETLCLPES